MPMTKEQLDNWFTYHPPTPEQRRAYDEIGHAEDMAAAALGTSHDSVSAHFKQFAAIIDQWAPNSADKTAAIRCVRLARNAANEALVAFGKPGVRINSAQLNDVALTELRKARWQANAAIACGGK